MTAAAPARGTELEALLHSRLRRTLSDSTLDDRVATVVFDAGDSDRWTVELDRGRRKRCVL